MRPIAGEPGDDLHLESLSDSKLASALPWRCVQKGAIYKT